MNTKPTIDAHAGEREDFSNVHLVHVVRQYLPNVGGLEDVVRNLTHQQKGRFASLKVVTLDRLFQEPENALPSHEQIDGIDIHRISYFGNPRYPIAPGVLKAIADADLVHVHAVDFFFDGLAMTKFLHRKKMVATTHGGFFHTKKNAAIKKIWFNTLSRFSASRYAGLACCSQSDLNQFKKIAPKRATLIENGVDIEKFVGASSNSPQKKLLALGRFSTNKRLDRAIELLASLHTNDKSWQLEIAGMESDLKKDDLMKHAAECGVAEGVHVHVALPVEKLKALISGCSFFVSASEYEGFGLAVIEAMSAGLVPIVHPNDTFKILGEKHPQVHLVDFEKKDDVASILTDHIAQIDELPALREKLMQEAQVYGWNSVISKYDQLYKEALSL